MTTGFPALTFAMRTYGREQLSVSLACLYCLSHPGRLLLAVDERTVLTPTQGKIIVSLRKKGWQVISLAAPPGLGAALYVLLREAVALLDGAPVLFLDDDIMFTEAHLRRLIAAASRMGAATYLMSDLDPFYQRCQLKTARRWPMHDPYCTLIDVELLASIPLSVWAPVQEMGAAGDLFYFHKVLELSGIAPNVLVDLDRPRHLFIPDRDRKPWGEIDIDVWFGWVRQVYPLPDLPQVLQAIAQLKEAA